jgi:uncharacterized protein (DUF1499 family)
MFERRRDLERHAGRARPLATSAAALAATLCIGVLMGIRPAWFTTNDVTTGSAPGYPELTAHRYAEPLDAVFTRARELAAAVPRWTVVREEAEERRLDVEVRTALFNFTDDLTVRVEPDGDGSRVIIRSRSRVGRGDLGENARHIAALQRRMDAALHRR